MGQASDFPSTLITFHLTESKGKLPTDVLYVYLCDLQRLSGVTKGTITDRARMQVEILEPLPNQHSLVDPKL